MYSTTLETPVGPLHLIADNNFLYRITLPNSHPPLPRTASAPAGHRLICLATSQLRQYFAGSRQHFDLPLAPQGTPFQLAVWQLIQQIPFGSTLTYGELAARLGSPNKARAVGGAANRNPLPLLIPCHRVLGAGGKLTGFAGGLEMKQFLLTLEQKKVQTSAAADV
jgi:methylated-DNA-[protein]-cysteine S-methyltransferase